MSFKSNYLKTKSKISYNFDKNKILNFGKKVVQKFFCSRNLLEIKLKGILFRFRSKRIVQNFFKFKTDHSRSVAFISMQNFVTKYFPYSTRNSKKNWKFNQQIEKVSYLYSSRMKNKTIMSVMETKKFCNSRWNFCAICCISFKGRRKICKWKKQLLEVVKSETTNWVVFKN